MESLCKPEWRLFSISALTTPNILTNHKFISFSSRSHGRKNIFFSSYFTDIFPLLLRKLRLPPYFFVFFRTAWLSYLPHLLASHSLYFQVLWRSCRRNELNLSPTVQCTDLRENKSQSSRSLLGIGRESAHVNFWWGWGSRWGTSLCQRGTRGHLLICHPHSVCWSRSNPDKWS